MNIAEQKISPHYHFPLLVLILLNVKFEMLDLIQNGNLCNSLIGSSIRFSLFGVFICLINSLYIPWSNITLLTSDELHSISNGYIRKYAEEIYIGV